MTTRAEHDLVDRMRTITPPTAILSRETAAALTKRQGEILDDLGRIFDQGFANLTMAEIAAELNCSLRTLYSLASSRNELVLIVVDRNLWRIGRAARAAIGPEMEPIEAIRSYLRAANVAVATISEAFATDTAAVPAANELNEAHSNYLIDTTRVMLDEAVTRGEIADCDTTAVARVVAGLGREFARPDVIPTLAASPKEAADAMVDVILRGLVA